MMMMMMMTMMMIKLAVLNQLRATGIMSAVFSLTRVRKLSGKH